jgi:Glycosyltransferase family 87
VGTGYFNNLFLVLSLMFTQRYFLVLITLVTIISISFYATLKYHPQSIYNDLKTRVTGTRLANIKYSAYFHKWNPTKDDIRLLNTDERAHEIVNGNTVTPSVLVVTKSFHELPLKKIIDSWFILSYAALFSILFLFYKKMNLNSNQFFIFLISALFLLSVAWRGHILIGQIYIFYTLIGVWCLFFYSNNKKLPSGIFAGFLVGLRFPAAILFLPFLFFKEKKLFIIGGIIGFITIVSFSIYEYGFDIWQDYFKAMKIHGLENSNAIPPTITIYEYSSPEFTEGVPNRISTELSNYMQWCNGDIFSIQRLLVKLQLPSTSLVLITLYGSFATLLFLLVNRLNKDFYKKESLLILFSTLLFFVADYFLPALRFNYNFVQFLVPLSVLFFYKLQISKISIILLCIGIALSLVKLFPESYSVGEVFCILSMITILIQNKK